MRPAPTSQALWYPVKCSVDASVVALALAADDALDLSGHNTATLRARNVLRASPFQCFPLQRSHDQSVLAQKNAAPGVRAALIVGLKGRCSTD